MTPSHRKKSVPSFLLLLIVSACRHENAAAKIEGWHARRKNLSSERSLPANWFRRERLRLREILPSSSSSVAWEKRGRGGGAGTL